MCECEGDGLPHSEYLQVLHPPSPWVLEVGFRLANSIWLRAKYSAVARAKPASNSRMAARSSKASRMVSHHVVLTILDVDKRDTGDTRDACDLFDIDWVGVSFRALRVLFEVDARPVSSVMSSAFAKHALILSKSSSVFFEATDMARSKTV